jgi:hypothetical protein
MHTPRSMRMLGMASIAAVVLALAAEPAAAKGPIGVSITGPGLVTPIVLRPGRLDDPTTAAAAESQQRQLEELIDGSGLWGQFAWSDADPPPSPSKPAGDLGTRYRLKWSIPGLGASTETDDVLVQDAYVRPGAVAVFFTPKGQPLYDGGTTLGGWHSAPPTMTRLLADLGVPSAATPVAVAAPVDTRSLNIGWPSVSALILGLVLLLAL